VTPQAITLQIGQSQQFTATGFDQFDDPMPIFPTWIATGGTIDTGGTYLAGAMPGQFSVTASAAGDSGPISGVAAVTVSATAPRSRYLEFDGLNDYVDIGDSDALDLTGGALTLSAWINPATWGEIEQGRILDHGGGSDDTGGWTFQLWGRSQGLMVQIAGGPEFDRVSDSNAVLLNQWQHVAVTLDAGTLTFYVDGIPRGVRTGVPTPLPRSSPVRIGMRATDTRRAFNGAIDEISIWSRALSQAELQALMTAALTGLEPGLVAYYALNDSAGQFALDASPNAHHGILGSSPGPDESDPAWTSIVDPSVRFLRPLDRHIQSSPDLYVEAAGRNVPAGWGVRFVLDEGTASEVILDDISSPFAGTFTGVDRAEHTVDAYVVDNQGALVPGVGTHDRVSNIGVGGYYVAVGNSITRGSHDTISSDNSSLDGRNVSAGYPPILNNLLTAHFGYPFTVEREAVGGRTSADGLLAIGSEVQRHPEADCFLIMYGTNDAMPDELGARIPSGLGLEPGQGGYDGSYKANMQGIIDAVLGAGKIPILAKVPITFGECGSGCPQFPDPATAEQNLLIQEYNQVIDELVVANGLTVEGPDFYAVFAPLGMAEYDDFVHPNGEGYQRMAAEWFAVLSG
jgi:lysophospholipase L1-like esterase